MKIKAMRDYFDKMLNKRIAIGETYEVTEERGNEIISVGYAEKIRTAAKVKEVEVAEVKEEAKEKAVVKRTARRK